MKALLLWPVMPNSFWSYQETLDLAGLRSTNPPLGLITVAAMLPADWEIRFVDRNVRYECLIYGDLLAAGGGAIDAVPVLVAIAGDCVHETSAFIRLPDHPRGWGTFL